MSYELIIIIIAVFIHSAARGIQSTWTPGRPSVGPNGSSMVGLAAPAAMASKSSVAASYTPFSVSAIFASWAPLFQHTAKFTSVGS